MKCDDWLTSRSILDIKPREVIWTELHLSRLLAGFKNNGTVNTESRRRTWNQTSDMDNSPREPEPADHNLPNMFHVGRDSERYEKRLCPENFNDGVIKHHHRPGVTVRTSSARLRTGGIAGKDDTCNGRPGKVKLLSTSIR